jgi:hypothetical protein
MTRRQLTALVKAWHEDNPTLRGEARQARQRGLWDALATAGGIHNTGELLAICDDVEPFVVVLELAGEGTCFSNCTHFRSPGNRRRITALCALNTQRFAPARKAVAV